MANSDRTLSLLKIMTNDVKVSDSELTSLMQLVLDEILVETRIIKKMYQLTIFDSLEFYDLKSNATLQDKYETGVSGVSLTNPTSNISDVISLMSGASKLAKPTISFSTEAINEDIAFIAIDDIFNDKLQSVMEEFEIINGHRYNVKSLKFRQEYNDIPLYYIASILANIDKIDEGLYAAILPVVIQGVKFYLYNDPVSKTADQSNNYHAMRYFRAKESLMNMYPQKLTMKRRATKWL